MTDILEWLIDYTDYELIGHVMGDKLKEAADTIEALRAENAKLLVRLEKAQSFISRADWMQFFEEEHDAAAALKEPGDES